MDEKMHSAWFEKIRMYYDTGRWSLPMVKNAVKKGKITEEEFKEITGIEYAA